MCKVLIVEDDMNIRNNISELLMLNGFDPIMASDGKDALLMVEAETPDLIISDVLMPRLTGFQLKEKLQEDDTWQNIPFVFLSAKTEVSDIRNGMNLGADDYITKPFHHSDLIKTIKVRLQKQENRGLLSKPMPQLPDELLKEKGELQKLVDSLSGAERRVLNLLSQNFSSVEIGKRIFLSTKTVQNHRANMVRKLNLSGQNSLLNLSIRCNVLGIAIS
jgi:DNA-binding response OmpR family regulator